LHLADVEVLTYGRFDLHPERLAVDTGDASAEMLDWLVNEQGIEPHVPGSTNPNVRWDLRPDDFGRRRSRFAPISAGR
jgi:hypothetical protein